VKNAAENGDLEVLKYLREEAKAPWDDLRTAAWAAAIRSTSRTRISCRA